LKKLVYILLGLVLLTGCSRDDDGLTSAGMKERVPLEILASIHAQAEGGTRAAETSWDEGDEIGVYITNRNSTTLYTNDETVVAENQLFTFSDGTNYETWGTTYRKFSAGSKKIYLSSAAADVYGYYPYSAKKKDGITDLAPEAIDIDVSDQSKQEEIDFLMAKKGNVSDNNATIELLFQHRMVKLVFNLKQGEGLLTDELKDATYLGMEILNQPTKATYNLFVDAFSNYATHGNIIPAKVTAAPTGYVRTYEAIVLPNGIGNPTVDRTVTVTYYHKDTDIITNTFKIPAATQFNAGYKYTFNVTVNATSIKVNTDKFTEQW